MGRGTACGGGGKGQKVSNDKQKQQGKQTKGKKKIKKIIAIGLYVFICIGAANAVPMCAQTTTTATVLDPNIAGLSYDYNNSLSLWTVSFPYGTINGVSACLSSNYDKSFAGTVSQLTDNGARVVGGETNGEYCWCKMTHPAVSLWAFTYSSSSASVCASYCALNCGYGVQNDSSLRAGLFGSVAR